MTLTLRWKIGLGVLAVYSSYTSYLYYKTQQEIRRRLHASEKLKLSDQDGDENGLLSKFGSLTVNGRFENPFPEYRPQTVIEFFAMRFLDLLEFGKRGKLPPTVNELRDQVPVRKPDLELIKANELGLTAIQDERELPNLENRLTFTWFGQSCSLLQLSGVSFLTDPLFEDYLITKLGGPKRITPSPISLEGLLGDVVVPRYVLVSHDHPDHLEDSSIKRIGNSSTWIVPMGLRHFLGKHGITNVIEMDWWDRVPLSVNGTTGDSQTPTYEVVCLPAMHWSGRCLLDTNKRLWCSFMILKNGKSVFYHCGDTGYTTEMFKAIGEKYGPVKLAALPIGQYCPQWHQRPRHINPLESLRIFNDLGVDKMVGVHWGTFILSSEKFNEPKEKLQELAKLEGLENSLLAPDHGRTIVMDIESVDTTQNGEAKVIRDGRCIVYK